jgi:hypothetical protein
MEIVAMGGLIFVFLILFALVILLTRVFRNRASPPRDDIAQTAHEAVISKLEDHRRRRQSSEDTEH